MLFFNYVHTEKVTNENFYNLNGDRILQIFCDKKELLVEQANAISIAAHEQSVSEVKIDSVQSEIEPNLATEAVVIVENGEDFDKSTDLNETVEDIRYIDLQGLFNLILLEYSLLFTLFNSKRLPGFQ